jgi:hypothetical protein
LIEFKTVQSSALPVNLTNLFSASIRLGNDQPIFTGAALSNFETIGGTSIRVPVRTDVFKTASHSPFSFATLAFSASLWSSVLNAAVSVVPVQTTVRFTCVMFSIFLILLPYLFGIISLTIKVNLLCVSILNSQATGTVLFIGTSASSAEKTLVYNFTATSGMIFKWPFSESP